MSTEFDGRPVVPGRGRLRPLGIAEVEITGGFWGVRQEVNSSATIEHCHDWMERMGWVDNFRAAVENRLPGDRRGVVFTDSDVYKLMEAAAWEGGRSGSVDATDRFLTLTDTIAPAQEADGYLSTYFGRPGQPPRYSDLEWGHELYCYGHMIQAAIARARTGHHDLFVEVARKAADHVCRVFADGEIERVGGHPEIELGLVELARLTGEERYLVQASTFIERRGHGTLADTHRGRSYFQDDTPIRQYPAFTGHAVRALYLAAAAVDVAVETGDEDLLEAIIRQWERTVGRRTYLTGGMGSHHDGEQFGEDFVLPPDRAYSETCAGIASVMLAWRLLLATGEPRFADLIERTLFNVVATSPAPDGRAFFYANPLHQRVPGAVPSPDTVSKRASSSLREPWFEVSCCPTNVARTVASLGAYVATADPSGLQIQQFIASRITTDHEIAGRIQIEIKTDYPREGSVRIEILESGSQPWALALRIPQWAEGARTVVHGREARVSPGFAVVEGPFSVGDLIHLHLPVTPRWTFPDPRIDAVRHCVAVEAGPLVMCLESIDMPAGTEIDTIVADVGGDLTGTTDQAIAPSGSLETDDAAWPYSRSVSSQVDLSGAAFSMHPYHSWGNRGPTTMRVWIPSGDH